MLATVFITGGIDTLRNPGPRTDLAADVATATADALPIDLPDDPETLVKLDAIAKVAGGAMLASGGRTARLGAVICAASLVPTTIAGHRFWDEDDPAKRAAQQIHFAKNVSLLGGLLIAALDTGGRPSVPWRAKRRAAKVHAKVGQLHAPATTSAVDLAGRAGKVTDRLHDTLGDRLGELGEDLSHRAEGLVRRVADADLPERVADRAGDAAHHLAAFGSDLSGRVAERVG